MLHKKGIGLTYALKGLQIAWQEERNFQVQSAITVVVFIVGTVLGLARWEWLFIVGAVGAVLTAELFNTALEELCDMYKTEHDPHIAKIKDLAAAAVFIASCGAVITALFIFLPHLLHFV